VARKPANATTTTPRVESFANPTTVTITGTREIVERTILNLARGRYVKITVPIAPDVIEQCDVISKDRFEATIEMKD
jgi:hypothetical protein